MYVFLWKDYGNNSFKTIMPLRQCGIASSYAYKINSFVNEDIYVPKGNQPLRYWDTLNKTLYYCYNDRSQESATKIGTFVKLKIHILKGTNDL